MSSIPVNPYTYGAKSSLGSRLLLAAVLAALLLTIMLSALVQNLTETERQARMAMVAQAAAARAKEAAPPEPGGPPSTKALEALGLPTPWEAALVAPAGALLPPGPGGMTDAPPLLAAAIAADEAGWVEVTEAGNELLAHFQRLPQSQWAIVVFANRRDLNAPAHRAVAKMLAAVFGCTLLALAVARWLTVDLVASLNRATGSALAIGRGEAPQSGRSPIAELEALETALRAAHQQLADREAALTRAMAEAEAAAQAKTRLLASISHDLRQPLQAIFLFVGALTESTDPRVRAHAERIERSANILKSMVDAFLDLAKLEAGAIQPKIAAAPLRQIIEELDHGFHAVAAAKGLAWHTAAPDVAVCTDPLLVGRLLGNIVQNAIRYTAAGGVAVTADVIGARAYIAVRDTGIGIPAAELTNVFEEFQRAGGSSATDGGLGLGLAIVRRLAALLGHQIEVASEPGHGSIFTVIVPLAP